MADETDDDDDSLIARGKKDFQICEEAWEPNRRDFIEDIRFGRDEEQWPEQIRRDREIDGRPCLTLNQLHAFIFQVVNDARQNKPGIVVHPVGSGADPETAKKMNGLIRHIEQSSDGDVAYDTAMDSAVSGGFGYFRINTRYSCDDTFEQELALERIADAASVYPDPDSTAADSSDWNKCFILDSMPKAAFEKKYPKADPVSFDGESSRDATATEEDHVQIAEWWSREEVTRKITAVSAMQPDQVSAMPAAAQAASRLLNQQMVVDMEVYEANKELFQALGVSPVGKTRDVISHKVTQRICSGAEVLETVEWAGKYIPIVPVWGEEVFVEGRRVLRSLIRGAKDAQRMYNYWSTTSTEVVALAPKAPFIGKVGQFATDGAKWANANTATYAYLEYDDVGGAPAPERQPFAGVPAGAIQQTAQAQQNIMSIIGIYKSSIGAPSNETSGVAIDKRDKQADTGSFHFTDNLNRAIRHAGRILLDLIPKVYSTPRVLRILNPDGSPEMFKANQPHQTPVLGPDGQPKPVIDPRTGQPAVNDNGEPVLQTVEKIYDLTVGKYDLVVKAGPSYSTQREEFVAMATEIIRVFPQSAPVLADLIFRNYDMPDADEIADRLQALLPPQVRGADPRLQQAQQIIQEGKQYIQSLEAENQRLKGRQAFEAGKLEVDRFEAETDRLKVFVGKDGAPVDMTQAAPLLMAMLAHTLTSPDLFAAMQQGVPPEQLAQMLAAKMGQGGSDDQGGGSAPPAAVAA